VDTSWRALKLLMDEHLPGLTSMLRKVPCLHSSEPFDLSSEDFYEMVLRPLLDMDRDDRVTAQELHVLSVRCKGWKR
jgi:hypothetical protein